ncbi:MAG: rRNA maturation RNase YbeY [Erysipelotrichaceae bacterium]
MEINITNQTEEKKWLNYKKLFIEIAKRTEVLLKLKDDSSTSVIFVTSKQIHEINLEYRKIDRPTDVISFAMHDSEEDYEHMEGDEELGDIFINVEAVVNQADEYGHTIKREVGFLFVHGLLHLLGYDHMNPSDEAKMFKLQDDILDEIVKKSSK